VAALHITTATIQTFHMQVTQYKKLCHKLVNQLYHKRMLWLVFRKNSWKFSSDTDTGTNL